MKNDKYLSIITNFGCHGKCPYCIVLKNGINVPKTTLGGLRDLKDTIINNDYNIVSVSGGGDPLHNYEEHTDYYKELFLNLIAANVPMEMHTSYIDSAFPYQKCKRVVYHLRDIAQLSSIKRHGNELIRVVFVATPDLKVNDILTIGFAAQSSKEIDELSMRQMVNDEYETMYYNHDILKAGHEKGLWHYIEQADSNDYYVNGKIYTRFSDIGKLD